MVELDQFKYTLNGYTEPLKEVRDSLDLENKEKDVYKRQGIRRW